MDDSDKGDGLVSASPPTAKRRWFFSCLAFFLRLVGALVGRRVVSRESGPDIVV